MKKLSLFNVVFILVLLLSAAFTTPINAYVGAAPTVLTPADGSWTGTTSLSQAVSFTVSSGGAQWSAFALGTAFTTSGCSSAYVTMTVTVPGPGSISSNAFSYTNGGSTYSFSGVFDSPYTAHGTYAFSNYRVYMSPTCYYYLYQTGTWTASTPMPPPGAFGKISPPDGATNQTLDLQLTWGSSANATSYDYCFDTTDDSDCSNWTSNGSNTSAALSGLSQNTTYYWQVRSNNTAGTAYADGSSSTFWSFTTGVLPGVFGKNSPTDDAISVSLNPTIIWDSSTGSTGYEYCYDTTNDNSCSGWTDNGSSTSVGLSALSASTTYYWQVRAKNTTGTTEANSGTWWSFTTGVPPSVFNKSLPSDGVSGVSLSLTLTWNSSANATSYEYCYDTTNDSTCSGWVSVGGSTSVGLSGLSQYTTYYWQVRSNNSFGTTYANGSSTAFWSFTTGGVPGSFNKSSPSDGVSGVSLSPTLSWTSSSSATSYEYCYDTTNDSTCSGWVNVGSSTSLGLSGLSQYITYYWQVRANNSFGATYANGSSTAFWSFTTGGVPGTFNKSSPSNGATSVVLNPTLSWTSSSSATSYEYCYDTTNDSTCSGWTSSESSPNAELSGLSEFTTYFWQVRSLNSFGSTYADGGSTAYWSFTTGGMPGAFGKTSPANGATNVALNPSLSWASSTSATNYEYCYDTTNDGTCGDWTSNGTSTNVGLIELSQNTTYYWHVRAINSFGTAYANGSSTAFWSLTTGGVSGAFNKTSPSNGATSVILNPTLSWESSTNATSYEYCYDSTNDGSCSNWINNGTATSTSLSGLSQNITYYWQVRANNSFGTTYANDASTAFWSFTTGGVPGTFSKLLPSDGTNKVILNPTLSWASSTSATGYEYCYDSTNDSSCSSWISNGTATSVSMSGLSQNTTYYWQVRASNSFGATYANGEISAFWSFTTVDQPLGFSKISPSNGVTNQPVNPTLTWGASGNVDNFDYCIDTIDDNTCNASWVPNEVATSVTLSGLTKGTLYYWQVRAQNSAGYTYADGGTWWSFKTLPVVLTKSFTSSGANDGWVLESSETSTVGGTMNNTGTVFYLGDNASKKQYCGVLSFATGAGLPDNAVITSVTLKITKSAIVGGGNPVSIFQGFMIDVKKGFLGSAATLQIGDFQAVASKTLGPLSPVPVSNVYSFNLINAKSYINKVATGGGLTQIRLRFKLDDNNNTIANYLSFFSGNNSAGKPTLIIKYYIP